MALAWTLVVVSCGGGAVASSGARPTVADQAARAPSDDELFAAIAGALPPLPRRDPLAPPQSARTEQRPPSPAAGDAVLDAALRTGRYVVLEHPGFRVRLPATEAAAMAPYLPDLLDRASAFFAARYGAEPERPIPIDYYDDRDAYRARLSGRLPFDADGAYGDGVVIVLTPNGGAGGWGETLVHELAHAYQAAASAGRAPTWLCEGLAELDARGIRGEWRRVLESELAEVLEGPPVGALDRVASALARPTSARQLGGAYVASGEFVAFVERQGDQGVVARLLAAYAHGDSDAAALRAVTAASLPDLETAFVAALAPRLEAARGAHLAQLDVGVPEPSAVDGVATLARRASIALVEGRLEHARVDAEAALALDARDLVALHVRLRVAIAERDPSAETYLRHMVEGDRRVFEARVALARLALLRGDVAAAVRETDQALVADAGRVEGWDLRLRLADRGAPGVDRETARRTLVELDRHAVDLAFDLVAHADERSDAATVRRYGERLLYAVPGRPELHRMLERAYRTLGEVPQAVREGEVARALTSAEAGSGVPSARRR